MAVKDYEGNGITVHWDAERCWHSGRCVAGAPEVFDVGRRPWITATARSADDVAAVIETCPSGALSYTRTDGGGPVDSGPVGGDQSAPDRRVDASTAVAAAITPRRNGPLAIEGMVTMIGPDGTSEVMERAFLCRCGSSATKPFCDGAHKRVGFEADGVAPPAR